jgi:hypothetical protein
MPDAPNAHRIVSTPAYEIWKFVEKTASTPSRSEKMFPKIEHGVHF